MRLLATLLFCLCTILVHSQNEETWEDMMGNPNKSFYEIKALFDSRFPDKESIPGGIGHKPYKRWEFLMESRIDENGFYDPLTRQKEYNQFLKEFNSEKSSGNPWTILGPIGEPSGNNGVGRINVVVQHPSNTNILYVGTPAGGLWKSEDGGNSWTTNTDLLTNLGVSDIAFHPSDPNIMYIVTGDRDHNDTSTFGILKSTDGGNTWNSTGFAPGTNGLPGFYLIHRLLIDPLDPEVMIASTTSGVFRTDDEWNTYTEVLPNDCLRHMEFKTNDPNIIYGTTSGAYCGGLNSGGTFFRSADNGVSWTQISIAGSGASERMGIGVTEDSPEAVFLLSAMNDPNGSNDFQALYKSTDSGLSFTEVSSSHEPSLGSQQWYDWSFTVDPNDQDVMYAGGVHIEKTENGGITWTRVTNNGPNNVHVDHHYAKFYGSTLWVASDGGLWSTNNGADSWNVHNDGLAITQYYRMSNAETDESIVLTGSQDNGTHQLKNGTWIYEFGGDGMDNAIDPNDENNLFVSYQYGNFFRSTNGGGNFSSMISSSTTGTSGAWVTPIKIDENNTDIIYTGYDRIWKSTNDGVSWSDQGNGQLTGGSKLRYIDIAKSNSEFIYTTNYNSIWKSTDGGATWATTSDPGNNIRWIEIDPLDENHVWICRNNDVLESIDGGNSWTDISSNLPNISMNTIVYDGAAGVLYVGSDLGVFTLEDGNNEWDAFNTNLPNVIILELDILESESKLRAATFGRGTWEVSLDDGTCSIISIIDGGVIDCDLANNTYTRELIITYNNPPPSGSVVVMGQFFDITISPQSVIVDLPTDGAIEDGQAYFSETPACAITEINLFQNITISSFYVDSDNDGFGDNSNSVLDCEAPPGYVSNNADCNDNDPLINPNATELCDGIDNDCNGLIDESGDLVAYYADSDGDGFGDPLVRDGSCEPISGYVTNNLDCDDTNPNINPDATEFCDGIDNNCDGNIDEVLPNYYADNDGDGFGDVNNSIQDCNPPSGYVLDSTDCNDNNINVFPGNDESCDGIDNNCDGNIDEDGDIIFYLDNDNDGFGDASNTTLACNPPAGYVSDNTDCNDNDANIFPGNTESCDGIDNNCDGNIDEGCVLEDCDDVFLVINTLDQNVYRAEINVNSNVTVDNGDITVFTAGTDIDLVAPFEVMIGSEFEARIEPCSSSSVSPLQDESGENIANRISHFLSYSFTKFESEERISLIVKNSDNVIILSEVLKSKEKESFIKTLIDLKKGVYTLEITSDELSVIQELIIIK